MEILNDTSDFFSYPDLTLQEEFLYECVVETILKIISVEIGYLPKFGFLKN